MTFLATLKARAQSLKQEILTLYCVLRHPHTPRRVRWLALLIVAYALSPIDLIPDFIPVLGLLDDLILLPLGITLVLKLLPSALLATCRQEAANMPQHRLAQSKFGAMLVLSCWLLGAFLAYKLYA